MMKWDKREIELAINLLKKNTTYDEIGLELKRTSRSVKAKLFKLGFKYEDYKLSIKKNFTCKHCLESFEGFKKDQRIFCSQSCSATYHNLKRVKTVVPEGVKKTKFIDRVKDKDPYTIICKFCKKESHNRKPNSLYCKHECHKADKKKDVYGRIEAGDLTVSNRHYKQYLIEKYGELCMDCGWCKRNNYSNTIPIELEHIDGNSGNNNLENLKLLCPSCHSLTPTYRALNAGNGRHKRRERYQEGKSF